MVDIINIPDGDTSWGTKLRSNLTNLKVAIESVKPSALLLAKASKEWDNQTKVYNRTVLNSRRIIAGLAKGSSKSALNIIALLGDSTTAQYLSNGGIYSKDYLTHLLERNGHEIAGELIVANHGPGNELRTDERLTYTGTWIGLANSYWADANSAASQIGSKITYVSKRPGTILRFEYMANNGARYRIDGGAWVNLAAVGNTPTVVQVEGLTDAVHTFEYEVTSSSGTYLGYVGVFRPTGTIVLNAGVSGGQATDLHPETNAWYITPGMKRLQGFGLNAVFVNYAINDLSGGITVETYKSNMRTALKKFNDYNITTITETPSPTGSRTFEDAKKVLYELADELDIPLVDINEAFGDWGYALANGLYGSSDNVHPIAAGYWIKAKHRFAALNG